MKRTRPTPERIADAREIGVIDHNLGKRIRSLRKSIGLSQAALGDAAGINYSYVSQIERAGKLPIISVLARIAGALGTTAAALLGGYEQGPTTAERIAYDAGKDDKLDVREAVRLAHPDAYARGKRDALKDLRDSLREWLAKTESELEDINHE